MIWTDDFGVQHSKETEKKKTSVKVERHWGKSEISFWWFWCLSTATRWGGQPDGLLPSFLISSGCPQPMLLTRKERLPHLEVLGDQRLKHAPWAPHPPAGISLLLSLIQRTVLWFYDFLFTHPPEMIKLMALRSLPQCCPSGSSTWRLTISSAASTWPNLWDKKPHLDLEFFFLIVSYVTFDSL